MKMQRRKVISIIASWVLVLVITTAAVMEMTKLSAIPKVQTTVDPVLSEAGEKQEYISEEILKSERMTVSVNDINIEQNTRIDVEENLSTLYTLPTCSTYEGMKCYEDYRCITDKSSRQYELQQIAYTDKDGFRKIGDRYLVAIGTYFETDCGTMFDIILENDEKIPAIVGDIKSDIHTDIWNVYSAGKCATEFIVDADAMNDELLIMGDVSYYREEWKSKVKALYIYDKKIPTTV